MLEAPHMVVFAVVTVVQVGTAYLCWFWSRRTLAQRMRHAMIEARQRAEKAEKAAQIVFHACGPRLWAVYTRGSDVAGWRPERLKKKEGGKGKGEQKGKGKRRRGLVWHLMQTAAAAVVIGVVLWV